MLHVNMTFVSYFSFHELHVRSMQIYEKLILHLQIKIDFSILLAERRAGLLILLTNILFCLQNNFIVTSRKQRCLQETQKLDRYFEGRIFSPPQIVLHRTVDKI